jgi:starvation-inducible DNA-binding protein
MAFEISPNPGAGNGSGGPPSTRPARDLPGGEKRGAPTQPFTHVADVRLALGRKARIEGVAVLNQILADTMALRDLYKKHHWQTAGATFYQLHLLFDKHHGEQVGLMDDLAERIQMLGGVALAMSADVADTTVILRAPRDREEPAQQLTRLADAHERLLYGVRAAARRAAELGDDGTNDLLVSGVIRTNEMQAWFIQEHLQRGLPTRES